MADKDGYIENVGFLYRTMVERDPSKRRVKPVENHLQLLDFADLGDSSDDSDFQIDDHEKDLESDDQGDSSENMDDDDDDDDDEESSREASETEEKFSPAEVANGVAEPVETKKVPKLIVGDLIERARQRQSQARQRISGEGESSLKLKITICAVCLGDISVEDDEIVECDCCSVSVHEGCYGITDSDSVMSTGSSSSTEPWFCDACRAGQKEPICELCPNSGGIFKETDVGKWVHLVCALYIPGVAFGNVEKLTPVTLFEMPYSRWGAKSCVLCEDERLSRTGVCITCDAGMCKASFHVTCAQREGLLSEASMEEIADPFFAYCKLHADKAIVRSKRRNWLALQSRNKNQATVQDPKEKARVERKLAWHRERYQRQHAERTPPWVPTQKMARLLTSSPWACRQLLRKAHLMGVSQPSHLAAEGVADARRKWHVPPAFSLEFVSYFLDRSNRVTTMRRHLDELLQQNSELQDQEQALRQQYDKAVHQLEELKKEHAHMNECGTQYWKMLCDLTNKKLPVPTVLEARKPVAKPASRTSRRSDSGSSFLFECGVCKKSQDQHQLAKCDNCQLHYHLYCLDPPLTRMPKKTKSMGWQCSQCDKNSDEDKERHCDPNAPRRLRDQPRGTLRYEDFPFMESSPRKLQTSRLSRRVRQSRTCIVPDTSSGAATVTAPASASAVATATATTTTTTTTTTNNTTSSTTPTAAAVGNDLPTVNPTTPAEVLSQGATAAKRQRGLTPQGKPRARRRLNPEMQAYRKAKRAKRKSAPVAAAAPAAATPTPAPKSEPSTPFGDAVPGVSGIRMPVKRIPLDRDLKVDCKRCGNSGDCTNLVVCDECKKGYHFLCLYPPVRKSPKQRGYTWNCEECNSS
ncbi:PHD finger protein 14 isoform X2 [Amblyomma americanum]